jgi:hypothetical protein
MATGNDENPNNGPGSPFAFVLIPILGFGLIASLITCYRYRRKKRLARLFGDVQNLESGRRHRRTQIIDRGPNGVVILTNGHSWRLAENQAAAEGLTRGVGVGSREDGLNELGEAPPAYRPPDHGPKPPSEDGAGEHIELATYSQATAEAGMSRSPPAYGEGPPTPLNGARIGMGTGATNVSDEDTVGTREEVGSRDAMATTTTPTTTTVTNEPSRPPRAVLPSP